MGEIFFQDPTATLLPPAEVRIREMNAKPYPDGRRVLVQIDITPFQKRPWVEVAIHDSQGNAVSASSVIEPMTPRLLLTMHLRYPTPGDYTLSAQLYYPEEAGGNHSSFTFKIKPPELDAGNLSP